MCQDEAVALVDVEPLHHARLPRGALLLRLRYSCVPVLRLLRERTLKLSMDAGALPLKGTRSEYPGAVQLGSKPLGPGG